MAIEFPVVDYFSKMNNMQLQQQDAARQQKLSDLQMRNAETQGQEGQLRLSELQRQQGVEAGARNLGTAASMGPTQPGGTAPGPENQDRMLFEYYKANDPARAQQFAADIATRAKQMTDMGDPESSVKLMNDALGTTMKVVDKKDNFITIANGDGTHVMYDIKTGKSQTIGTAKPLIAKPGDIVLGPDNKTPLFTAPKEDTSTTEWETYLSDGRKANKPDSQILAEWDEREKGRKKAGATNLNVNTGKADTTGLETVAKEMPKAKEAAESAASGREKLVEMKRLLEGGAGGASGFAKAKLAPWLESVGVTTQGMNDAALYQTLAQTLAGSMRLQIVGPGPVSNYEQGLLRKVSGGGIQATIATQELLNYYDKEATKKINSYNQTVDQLNRKMPETASFYPRINTAAPKQPAAPKTPRPGELVKGYRFKGGDPANKNNWVKQ